MPAPEDGISTAAAVRLALPYLLLVEDRLSDIALFMAASSESCQGVAVHAVSSVTAAVSWLRGEGPAASRHLPALIVLDLHLHGAPGTTALIRFKATDAWKAIPVVVLTGFADDACRAECHRLGARSVMVKPMDAAGYIACTKQLCASVLANPRPARRTSTV